ncbi:hypothetical protein [Spongiimicrobium salis]|uniref:hypothetical protein n=1 Tax=Spongiimicrobium salis TaxID=1667022 RepID=UPI00374CC183
MNYSQKKILASFVLFTLMVFKVSALHVYSHQNDDSVEQCSICDVAIHSQDVELSTPPQIILPNTVEFIPISEERFNTVFTLVLPKVCHTLYGRPPPALD